MESNTTINSTNTHLNQTQNTITFDQSQPSTEQVFSSQMENKQISSLTTRDAHWSYSDIMNKSYLLETIPWATSSAQNALLTSISLPLGIFALIANLETVWSVMTYMRFGMRVKAFINGTAFHQGQCVLQYVPNAYSLELTTGVLQDSTQRCNFPHIEINPDTSETAQLDIPFNTPYSMYSRFDNNARIGLLQLFVLNQLQVATGTSAALNISLYIEFLEPVVKIPQFYNLTGTFTTLYNDEISELTKRLHDIKFRQLKFDDLEANSGGVTDVVSAAKNAVSTITSIESGNVVNAFTSGVSAVENAISGFAKILNGNFDHANKGQFQTRLIRDSINNPSLGVGGKSVKEMSLFPETAHLVPTSFNSNNPSELSVITLAQKPSFFRTTPWTVSQPSGTVLDTTANCPSSFSTPFSLASTVTVSTWLAAMSWMFVYWRGSIVYRLRVLATKFQSGKLVLAYAPNQYMSSTPTLEQAMQGPHLVWDLKQTHEIFFEVPFNSTSSYLQTQNFIDEGSGNTNGKVANSINGFFYVYVLNELVATNGTAAQVEINMWVYGGKDIQFKTLKTPAYPSVNYLYNTVTRFDDLKANAAEVGEDLVNVPPSLLKDQENAVAQKGHDVLESDNCFHLGEESNHLLNIVKRSALIYSSDFTASTTSYSTMRLPVHPLWCELQTLSQNATSNTRNFCNSHLSYISSMFAQWSGKLDYKFNIYSLDGSILNYQVEYLPNDYSPYSFVTGSPAYFFNSGYAYDFVNAGINATTEITVPHSQQFPTLLTNYNGNQLLGAQASNNRFNMVVFNGSLKITVRTATPTTKFHIDVFIAAGDDFMLYNAASPSLLYEVTPT